MPIGFVPWISVPSIGCAASWLSLRLLWNVLHRHRDINLGHHGPSDLSRKVVLQRTVSSRGRWIGLPSTRPHRTQTPQWARRSIISRHEKRYGTLYGIPWVSTLMILALLWNFRRCVLMTLHPCRARLWTSTDRCVADTRLARRLDWTLCILVTTRSCRTRLFWPCSESGGLFCDWEGFSGLWHGPRCRCSGRFCSKQLSHRQDLHGARVRVGRIGVRILLVIVCTLAAF